MSRARHALAADIPTLAKTLASAFSDDPVMQWVFGDGKALPGRIERWMHFNLELGLSRGHTYMEEEGRACAIWGPPDSLLFDDLWGPRMAQKTGEEVGDRLTEVLTGLGQVTGAHPDEPHFYLFVLGTHAAAQGRGLGARVLEPVLETCDREHLPAYLESSNIKNVPFYQRHGFEVQQEIPVCEGGPILRTMYRAAR